ncbi:MAG: ECF-type sigma factor [Acidobacteria bacterium]|nr:ECF-type sigma factor [Acidobacteriota bacterium]
MKRQPSTRRRRFQGPREELPLYRGRTVALLRRYFRMSIDLGRLPSIVGREFFRPRTTGYRVATFEDAVIFVHDMERCLEELDAFSQKLIARVTFQEFTHEEAAQQLGCARRTVLRRYAEALDRLAEMLLERELLAPLPCHEDAESGTCQAPGRGRLGVSDSAGKK